MTSTTFVYIVICITISAFMSVVVVNAIYVVVVNAIYVVVNAIYVVVVVGIIYTFVVTDSGTVALL